MHRPNSQRGSIFFYILLAIALFAALSAVVSKMMEGESNVDSENVRIQAGEVLTFAQVMRGAVRDLMISNQCSDTELSFERHPFDGTGTYYNSTSPADFSCHVFHANGGGVNPPAPLDDVNGGVAWFVTGANRLYNLGNQNQADLMLIYPELGEELCLTLNDFVDVDNPGGSPPQDSDTINTVPFVGAYHVGAHVSYSNLEGRLQGCYFHTQPDPDTYGFFQVVLAR